MRNYTYIPAVEIIFSSEKLSTAINLGSTLMACNHHNIKLTLNIHGLKINPG